MPVVVKDEQPETRNVSPHRDQPARLRPRLWFWLVLGTILLFFSYGANNIALAAWLPPVFLLHFARHE